MLNDVERLFAMNAIQSDHQQALHKLTESHSDHIENKVLMDLWRELSDGTETYWQAISAAAAFQEGHNAVIKAMGKLPAPIKARLFRALGETFLQQSLALQEIAAAENERDRKIAAL